jgi:hypothetical protein
MAPQIRQQDALLVEVMSKSYAIDRRLSNASSIVKHLVEVHGGASEIFDILRCVEGRRDFSSGALRALRKESQQTR